MLCSSASAQVLDGWRAGTNKYGDVEIKNTNNKAIQVSTNGKKRFIIDSAGNVGIGNFTDSSYVPKHPLDVYGRVGLDSLGALPSGTGSFVSKQVKVIDTLVGGNAARRIYTDTMSIKRIYTDSIYARSTNKTIILKDSLQLKSISKGTSNSTTLDSMLAIDNTGRLYKSGGGIGWGLTGNAGTSPTSNFLGTTDLQSLVFRTNNAERVRIDAGGNLLVGTTTSYWNTTGRGVIEVNGTNEAIFGFKVGTVQKGYLYHTGTDIILDNLTPTGSLTFNTNDVERIRINATGYVGIGTTTPEYPLDVYSYTTLTPGVPYFYVSNPNTTVPNQTLYGIVPNPSNYYVGIRCTTAIYASSYATYSDKRIKNIIGISNSLSDLEKLKLIQITDYEYKDKLKNGNRIYKKVIAQQVEGVLPEAVAKSKNFIPNVYENALQVSYQGTSTVLGLSKTFDLQVGDKIKVFNDKDQEERVKITAINGKSIVVEGLSPSKFEDKVFVYGKEVDDFRTVDYDAISMLNVSATQELAKQNEKFAKQNEELKKEVEELKKQMQEVLKKLK